MTDPLTRERQAREELKRADRDNRYWAEIRRRALWDLKAQLGTWPRVAEATGQTVPAVTKAAYKKAQED
jgi:hypothetical protein